jgi:hypothetical protein
MQEWYVHDRGATTGPFSTDKVKADIAAGKLTAEATFCVSGTTTFRKLGDLPELAPAPATPLPMVREGSCGACSCPIMRAMKKVIVLAAMTAVAYVLWKHFHHTGPVIQPL